MRYEDHGLAVVRQDVLKELALGVGIKGRGGLIEEHDLTVAQERTGNGYALRLTLTQSAALLAAQRVQALGQVKHEAGTAFQQGIAHVVIGGCRVTKQQVVANGATHERVALRHINEVATKQGRQGALLVVVIKSHGAVLRAQEGEKQTYEGGLAGTRLAEDGCAGGGN